MWDLFLIAQLNLKTPTLQSVAIAPNAKVTGKAAARIGMAGLGAGIAGGCCYGRRRR